MIKKIVVSKENIKEVFDKIYPVFTGDFATTHFWQPAKPGFVQGVQNNMFVNRDLIGPKRLLERKARMGKKNKYPYHVSFDYNNVIALRDKAENPSIFVGSRDEDSFVNIEVGDIFYFHSSGKFVYVDVDDLSSRNIGKFQLLVVPMHFNQDTRAKIDRGLEETKEATNSFYESQMRDDDEEPDCYSPNDDVYFLCVGNPNKIDVCKSCCLYEDMTGPYDEDIFCVTIP